SPPRDSTIQEPSLQSEAAFVFVTKVEYHLLESPPFKYFISLLIKRGLKNIGGGVVIVKPDVISEIAVACGAEVSIRDAISLSAGDGFSRFINLLVKSEET
nr:hypothetical protein [Tanacetum cinerariifolium]